MLGLLREQSGLCQPGRPPGKVRNHREARSQSPARAVAAVVPDQGWDHREAHRLTPMALCRVHVDAAQELGGRGAEEVMDWGVEEAGSRELLGEFLEDGWVRIPCWTPASLARRPHHCPEVLDSCPSLSLYVCT